MTNEPEDQAPERIWIAPIAFLARSASAIIYDQANREASDVEYVRADLASSSVTAPQGVEGWRTIESAPKDGTRILIAITGLNRSVLAFWNGGEWMTIDANDWRGRNISHWMPLPAPPVTGETK